MKLILIIIIILLIILSVYLYFKLESSKICAEEPIIDDILWILGNNNINNIEKVNCNNGQTGIKIK